METAAGGVRTPSATLFQRPGRTTVAAKETVMNPPTETSPEELAARAQGGCLESFERLVELYERQIFNFLRQRARSEQDAEDLTQETFVKAYRSLPRYRPALTFAPWLFVIARRCAASHFRSAEQFEELPAERAGSGESPAALLEQKDEQKSIWKLVRTLKPMQAEAVWLRYAEGFSVAETARIMNTNMVYVKVLLHRGRAQLAKLLTARGINPANAFVSGSINSKDNL